MTHTETQLAKDDYLQAYESLHVNLSMHETKVFLQRYGVLACRCCTIRCSFLLMSVPFDSRLFRFICRTSNMGGSCASCCKMRGRTSHPSSRTVGLALAVAAAPATATAAAVVVSAVVGGARLALPACCALRCVGRGGLVIHGAAGVSRSVCQAFKLSIVPVLHLIAYTLYTSQNRLQLPLQSESLNRICPFELLFGWYSKRLLRDNI